MADDGLRIVNTVDNSQIDKAFADMRKNIINSADTAQKQGQKIDDAFDRVAVSVTAASGTIKKRMYEASKNANALSASIIEQKGVVREIEADVKRLGDSYRTALKKGTSGASELLAELNAAKKSLDEEKSKLFQLNQEKAKAGLRVKALRGQYELMRKETNATLLSTNALTKGLAAIGGTMAIKNFISQVIQTRGEFQQLEVSFETMLGSAEKVKDLILQLTKAPSDTPFD